ncbi:MAG: sulfotransferase family protein [Myxococcota bacterium]
MSTQAKVTRLPVPRRLPGPATGPVHRIAPDGPTAREVARHLFDPRLALTGRRLRWYGTITPLWLVLQRMLNLGFALDDVLFPGHRDHPVVAPTFIFANARSGTTLLHRLMSLDEERWAAPKLYQSLFPAVTWHRAFAGLDQIDRRTGRHLRKLVDRVNDEYLGPGWEGIHELRLDKAEEDEAAWLWPLLTTTITLLFPDADRFERALRLDRVEPETRARYMAYYESIIQRLLYAAGGDRTFLNKNVFFAHRIGAVLERFPDARFIYLVRHPYDAIGSMLQMWYVAWEAHSPDIPKDSEYSRAMGQVAVDYYRLALDARGLIPPEQFHLVRFADLVADPRRAVERIYAHFGIPMTDVYAARLKEATAGAGAFKSRGHQYSLEEFGISRDDVYAQLRDAFEEFGFER